jgi:hypothetical protein
MVTMSRDEAHVVLMRRSVMVSQHCLQVVSIERTTLACSYDNF